jgi:hypothetical protein
LLEVAVVVLHLVEEEVLEVIAQQFHLFQATKVQTQKLLFPQHLIQLRLEEEVLVEYQVVQMLQMELTRLFLFQQQLHQLVEVLEQVLTITLEGMEGLVAEVVKIEVLELGF